MIYFCCTFYPPLVYGLKVFGFRVGARNDILAGFGKPTYIFTVRKLLIVNRKSFLISDVLCLIFGRINPILQCFKGERPFALTTTSYKNTLNIPIAPTLASVTIIPANNIPPNIAGRASLNGTPNTKAAAAPVQIPVPGKGIPTNIASPKALYFYITLAPRL